MAATDCEAVATGWLAQPVLAITSLAYVLVGIGIVTASRRSGAVAVGVIVTMVGIGSVAFHGPQPAWAGLAHDVPIGLLAAAIVVDGMRASRNGGLREYAIELRPAAGLMALAIVTYTVGRTGGPLCDPDGAFQFHGAWHVLSAVAIGLWAHARLRG
jgi:hypothetical protein